MWTCSLLKNNAWQSLQGRYWRGFWVCTVISLISTGGYTGFNISFNPQATTSLFDIYDHALSDATVMAILSAVLVVALAAILIGTVISICWSAFLSAPLNAGLCRYFMESRQSPAPFETPFTIFRRPYLNVVKVTFLTNLKIVLGVFLLIVPGIYWGYCYVLVPYLMAENPYLDTRRAMDLSKAIMEGEKWHYFVLELSFIGWDLLCLLTFGIGSFFLTPYKRATFAEFYAAMRSKALSLGLSSTDELGGFVRHES